MFERRDPITHRRLEIRRCFDGSRMRPKWISCERIQKLEKEYIGGTAVHRWRRQRIDSCAENPSQNERYMMRPKVIKKIVHLARCFPTALAAAGVWWIPASAFVTR